VRDIEKGERGTKLGLFLNIDISLAPQDVEYFYCADIIAAMNRGEFNLAGLQHLRDHQNNISNEVRMTARVVKPGRGAAWLAQNSA